MKTRNITTPTLLGLLTVLIAASPTTLFAAEPQDKSVPAAESPLFEVVPFPRTGQSLSF